MAGGEENEDYMGDLSQFLPPDVSKSTSATVSSAKVELVSSSNKKFNPRHQQDHKKRKLGQQQMGEDKQTMARLDSAIPQSNIGFKLLKQMGYTPGSGLGKEGSGIAEPLGLEIKRGRGGIGKEDPEKEKMRRELENAERNKRKVEELMDDFGSRQKERWKAKRVIVNYRKGEAALAQLENRDIIEIENKGEEDEDNEEEEEEITKEDLMNILLKLRNEFNYCLFCGFQYESSDALISNCPGIQEDDH